MWEQEETMLLNTRTRTPSRLWDVFGSGLLASTRLLWTGFIIITYFKKQNFNR